MSNLRQLVHLARDASGRGPALAALLALTLFASCAAVQRDLATPVAAGIAVTDLRSQPAENTAFTDVSGTVVNDRSTSVSGVTVRVQQIDHAGQVLDSVPATLSSQTIPPNGGRVQFSARMSTMQLVTYGAVAEAP